MLKHVLNIGFLLFLAALTVRAEQPQDLFDRANQWYENQSYDSAKEAYLTLLHEGFEKKEIWYNLGNTYYQLNQPGYSIYYYNKFLLKAPGNKQVKHNLELAQIKATNKIDQTPTLFFVRWWRGIVALFSANVWLVLSLLFFWLFAAFWGWSKWKYSSSRLLKSLQTPLFILFLFFSLGAFTAWLNATNHSKAIIVEADNTLYSSPKESSEILEILPNGSKVKILDAVENWRKIKLKDGKIGWTHAKDVMVL